MVFLTQVRKEVIACSKYLQRNKKQGTARSCAVIIWDQNWLNQKARESQT